MLAPVATAATPAVVPIVVSETPGATSYYPSVKRTAPQLPPRSSFEIFSPPPSPVPSLRRGIRLHILVFMSCYKIQ